MKELGGLFKELLENLIRQLRWNWGQKSYESVVRCLLLRDEIAVKEAVDHLVEEGKVLAIPPIYLASKKHCDLRVREYCRKSLEKLDRSKNIEEVVRGKGIKEALEALVDVYGHFREDY